MNLKQLTKRISLINKRNLNQEDVKEVLECFMNITKVQVRENDNVRIRGFGTFHAVDRRSRRGVNPATGENMIIEGKKVIKFRASENLTKFVN